MTAPVLAGGGAAGGLGAGRLRDGSWRSNRWQALRAWRPLLPALVAAALALWYLVAAPMGTDLAAQIARADFAWAHPFTPIDLRWFSGTPVFGYSFLAPVVMAWLGVRVVGAVSCVLATAELTALFDRTGARRPVLGGVLAAGTQALNLVAGRVTFALGVVFALAALLTLAPRNARVDGRDTTDGLDSGDGRRNAGVWTAVAAFTAGAVSPVAALFLWVCAGALLLHGRVRDAVVLATASALPVLLASVEFGSGGAEPFLGTDARNALLATLALVVLAPRRPAMLRTGATIGTAMVVIAYALATPVGNNSMLGSSDHAGGLPPIPDSQRRAVRRRAGRASYACRGQGGGVRGIGIAVPPCGLARGALDPLRRSRRGSHRRCSGPAGVDRRGDADRLRPRAGRRGSRGRLVTLADGERSRGSVPGPWARNDDGSPRTRGRHVHRQLRPPGRLLAFVIGRRRVWRWQKPASGRSGSARSRLHRG